MANNTFQYFIKADEGTIKNPPFNSIASFDIQNLYRPNKDNVVTQLSLNSAVFPRAHYNVSTDLNFKIRFVFNVLFADVVTINNQAYNPGEELVQEMIFTFDLQEGYYSPRIFVEKLNDQFQSIFLKAIEDTYNDLKKTHIINVAILANFTFEETMQRIFLNCLHDSSVTAINLNVDNNNIVYETVDDNGDPIDLGFFKYDDISNRISFNYTWNHIGGLENEFGIPKIITKPQMLIFEADDGPIRSDVLSLIGLNLEAQEVPFDEIIYPLETISGVLLKNYLFNAGNTKDRLINSSSSDKVTKISKKFNDGNNIIGAMKLTNFILTERLKTINNYVNLTTNFDDIVRHDIDFPMAILNQYSPGVCNPDGITHVIVKLNTELNVNRMSNGQPYFAQVPYLHNYGQERAAYNFSSSGANLPTNKQINTLEVYLTDQDGKPMNFMGEYWSLDLNVRELTNVIPTYNDKARFF